MIIFLIIFIVLDNKKMIWFLYIKMMVKFYLIDFCLLILYCVLDIINIIFVS